MRSVLTFALLMIREIPRVSLSLSLGHRFTRMQKKKKHTDIQLRTTEQNNPSHKLFTLLGCENAMV